MLNVTNEVNQAWLQPSRQLEVKIFLNGEVYENDRVTSLSFEEESIVGESFQIGSTFINQLSVVFPEVIENLSIDQELTAEVGILVDETYHFSKLGKFIISECNRDRNNKTTTITALDQMILLEGVYDSKLTYPARIRDVALEIANLSGVEIDQVSFSTLPTTTIRKPEGYTHRQAIGLIAQFIGGFANFNRDGKLQVKRLNTTNFTIKPENYMLKGFTKNESTYRPNGITVRTGDEETDVLRVGSSSGNVISLENKIMTQPLLNSIWQYVKDITYFPFELKWQGNPNLEAGDWIYIEDREGIRYSVPNLSFSFTYNGGMRADSKATTSSSSEVTYRYRGTLKQQIEEIRGVLESATGGNHNYYDSETEPPNPKVGDTWFKKNGVNNEIWQYELVDGDPKWVLKISDAPNEALLEAIRQAIEAGEEARLAGEQATQAGLEAKQAGQQAQQAGLEAKEAGERAELVAQQAEQVGANALAEAELAKTVGEQAKTAGETAQSMVTSMEGEVATAISQSDNAVSLAQQAVQDAGFATDIANTAQSLATTAQGNASTALTNAQTALNTANTAKSDVTTLTGTVNTLSGEVELKANQTTVDTLSGRVGTSETAISANTTQIGLRATTATVDTLTGRVSSAESTLSTQAGSITALNTLASGHTTQIGNLQSSYSGLQSTVATVRSDLDGLEIGGRNLLKRTGDMSDVTTAPRRVRGEGHLGNVSIGITVTSGYSDAFTGSETVVTTIVPKAKEYTISFWAKADRTVSFGNFFYSPNTTTGSKTSQGQVRTGNDDGSSSLTVGTEWTYFWITWTQEEAHEPKRIILGRLSVPGTLWINSPMLVEGNKPVPWQPAPEDQATVTAFSTLQQTVSGIQGTVANKANQSEVTQLAGQITSVVSDLSSIGTDNIFPFGNAENAPVSGNWFGSETISVYHDFYMNRAAPVWVILNPTSSERIIRTRYIPIQSNSTYTVKFWGFNNSALSSFDLYVMWNSETGNGASSGFNGFVSRTGERLSTTGLESFEFTFTTGNNWKEIYIRLDNNGRIAGSSDAHGSLYFTDFMLVKGKVAPSSYSLPTSHFSSQITQLSNMIDQRVSKGELIGQINTQAGRVLIRANDNVLMVTPSTTYIQDATIKTAHIADANISTAKIANLAVSEGKIANLAVTDAKIASLTANKLTAGTIDASVITVSKINASNITTGQMEVARLKVADLRVNTANINDLQVSTAKLANLSVSEGKIANLAVATGKIADLAVTGAKIANATIGTAKIGDLQVTGAKIADATIASAKIISLDVNKLVANNASVNKLSAISANLGDVTAGSITGVTITGGIITQTNNKYTMNMSNGALRFARGGSDIGYLGVANDASKNPIGMAIFQYPGEIFSIASLNSAGTTSSNVFVIPSSSSQGNAQWRLNGEGIIQAGSLAVNAPMTVEAAATFNRNVTLSRELNIGDSNREHKIFEDVSNYKLIFRSEYGYEFYYNRSNIYERMITIENNKVQIGGGSQGGDGYFNDTAAGMSFGRDGGTNAGGNRIWSRAIYNRTYSGSSNMYITDAGTIGRSTSARKYKTDIQVANQAIVNAQKVLQIQPSSWLDKAAVESGKSTHRYYGFIADDFHDKGLKEVVMYGSDGQVESLAYDRISMYHNVILADHEKQLRDIKNENMRMIGEISMLRNEVESLRQLVA
ncbi:hypothetical protein [Enterococcus olivae]